MIHDDRVCTLGEGPLWHPLRRQLFWFDILGNRMLSRSPEGPQEWHFPERVSAAGWISATELMIASETGLFRFDLDKGTRVLVAEVEADNPATRSNDGRADRQGGFWFGTMGKRGGDDPGAGAIYRFFRGELRRLYAGITIPNAICFSPDGRTAHFTDTLTHKVMRVALDTDGWPAGTPSVYLDLTEGRCCPMARSATPQAICGWRNGARRGSPAMPPTGRCCAWSGSMRLIPPAPRSAATG